MKALQTITSMNASAGGPSTCTFDLLKAMNQHRGGVDLLTVGAADTLGASQPWMKLVPSDEISPLAYSHNAKKWLQEHGVDYDLFHANALWKYLNHATCSFARKADKPYVITPHGMLYPEAMNRSSWKKWIARQLWFDRDILSANCLHATSRKEMEHIRAFGYQGPVAILPNPVPIPSGIRELLQSTQRQRRIGYLGRLHPYKRPDALIEAFALSHAEAEGYELVLMGTGDYGYVNDLHKLVDKFHLKNVHFLGQIEGARKYEELAKLKALCVPSISENFGMSIAESLICHTPVICTNTAPWEDLNTASCGWWIDNSVESLAQCISEVLSLEEHQLQEMGQNGYALVSRKYSDIEVSAKMWSLYDWLLSGGPKPAYIFD